MTSARSFFDYFFIIYEDDSVAEKGRKLSLRYTFVFWLVFTVFSIFVVSSKPKENEYKEIKITLSSPEPEKLQAQELSETAAVEKALSSAQAVQSVKKEPAVPAQKPQAAQPPQSAKPAQAPKPVKPQRQYTIANPQTYGKTTEQLMAEQFAAGKPDSKNPEWNDSAFNESSKTVTSAAEYPDKPQAKAISDSQALQGTSATGQEKSEEAVASNSNSRGSGTNAGSEDVQKKLGNIGKAESVAYSGDASGDVVSTSRINSYNSSSGLSLEMEGGRFRRLIEPEKPVINISEENAKLIETSIPNLKIRFKVLTDGTVLLSGIQIPSSSLPQAIQAEIKEQIAKWRFEPDPSESTAVFDFSIIKK